MKSTSPPTIGERLDDAKRLEDRLRFQSWRFLHPEEIYLHAGTREGAKALGLAANRKSLPITSLPVINNQVDSTSRG